MNLRRRRNVVAAALGYGVTDYSTPSIGLPTHQWANQIAETQWELNVPASTALLFQSCLWPIGLLELQLVMDGMAASPLVTASMYVVPPAELTASM